MPGKRAEGALGKMLIHFTDSSGWFQAGEMMFLLTEQLPEARWKGHVACVFIWAMFSFFFFCFPPQRSCAGANSKGWRAGLE